MPDCDRMETGLGTYIYVAAYIRLLHGKIGFWVFFSALAP